MSLAINTGQKSYVGQSEQIHIAFFWQKLSLSLWNLKRKIYFHDRETEQSVSLWFASMFLQFSFAKARDDDIRIMGEEETCPSSLEKEEEAL